LVLEVDGPDMVQDSPVSALLHALVEDLREAVVSPRPAATSPWSRWLTVVVGGSVTLGATVSTA